MRDLKHLRTERETTSWLGFRVRVLGALFLGCLAGLMARAVQLQVHQQDRLKGFAEDQYVRELTIPVSRGDIVDRRGAPLARSVEVDSVYADPSMLQRSGAALEGLGAALSVDVKELEERLARGRRFAWLKRQVSPQEAGRVRALGLAGVGFLKEPRRFYPQRELAAHVIGFVGTDGHGLEGLEKAFDDELSRDPVVTSGFRDARGRQLLTAGLPAAHLRKGASMVLTLDRTIQYVAEERLERAVAESKAQGGVAVVMDVRTGEILALAASPRFNPNTPATARKGATRNRALTDALEPGSTVKALVMAAALDRGVVKPDSTLEVDRGAFRVGGHVIHDTHPAASLSLTGVLKVSSNIGMAKVAQKLGRDGLHRALLGFGFGERPGLLPAAETRGSVPYPRAEVTLATQAFGQGFSASVVQLASAFAALGNQGVLMRPILVSKVVDADGVVLLENTPSVVRRVVSAQAARTVVAMLESVVEPGGTGTRARMDSYRVAGKTGTAQKADPVARGYSDARVASFVGLLPAEDPRVVVLVVIDEPQTDVYGGVVAAPAFKDVALAAMTSLGVAPSRLPAPPPTPVPEEDAPRPSAVVAAIERALEIQAVTEGDEPEGAVRVPDVVGQGGRVAVARVLHAALLPQVEGSGRVLSQRPRGGTVVERGTRITLELGGAVPPDPP